MSVSVNTDARPYRKTELDTFTTAIRVFMLALLESLVEGLALFEGLWMEEMLHRFYIVDTLPPRAPSPFLTSALKASRNRFVPKTEILHSLIQNRCQC